MQQSVAAGKNDEKVLSLTDDELEHVAGGSSAGDWFAKNWKVLLVGLAVGVVASVGLGFLGSAIGSAGSAAVDIDAFCAGLTAGSRTGMGISMTLLTSTATSAVPTVIGASIGAAIGIGATVGMALTDNALNS